VTRTATHLVSAGEAMSGRWDLECLDDRAERPPNLLPWGGGEGWQMPGR